MKRYFSDDKFSEYIVMVGMRPVYRFTNGYGASLVQRPGSYGYDQGLFELAVLKFDDSGNYNLDYDTPITNDVILWLDNDQIDKILGAISRLDKNGNLKEDDPWFGSEGA